MPRRTVLTFAVAVAFTVCDYLLLNDIIPNRGPRLTGYDLIKTAVAVVLAVALVSSIYADGREEHRAESLGVARPGPVILNLMLATAFVPLFVVSPAGFNWLGSEDNVVEYLSALFGVAGAVFFARVALAAGEPRPHPDIGLRERLRRGAIPTRDGGDLLGPASFRL